MGLHSPVGLCRPLRPAGLSLVFVINWNVYALHSQKQEDEE